MDYMLMKSYFSFAVKMAAHLKNIKNPIVKRQQQKLLLVALLGGLKGI
jgi:hypothetical protein